MPPSIKKLLLFCLLILACEGPLPAQAGQSSSALSTTGAEASAVSEGKTLVLAGAASASEIHVSLSADGQTYLIASSATLEGGGSVCTNPPGNPYALTCPAVEIAAFEFNGGPGNDDVSLAKDVPAAAILRGGAGNDTLIGGAGNDKLVGGPGDDTLIGGRGEDRLYGGSGNDELVGGPGVDVCRGGSGIDVATGCEIESEIP